MYRLLFLLIIGFLGTPPPNMEGSYSHKYGKNGAYQSIQIHNANSSKILFYLEVNRGAPSYNSGAMYGELFYNIQSSCFEYNPTESYGCKLRIIKQNNTLIVKTIKGDCGFGYGVSADGIYYLKDKSDPLYIITRAGKKVYFEKTPPERFSEDR